MTTYLIKGAAILGGEPDRPAAARRRRSPRSAPTSPADGRRGRSTPTGLVALPGLVDLHTHLREPGREDAETVETGTRAAALGGFTAVHAMANTDPVADTAGVVEQVWRLGREAGYCDVCPVGAVTVGLAGERLAELGAMADSAARVRVFSDDGKCVSDAGADAPGAGVRQGVRRRRRPARPGAAAHRGRPDERGRALRPARPAAAGRRSPRRRSSPATACSPRTSARGCTSATSRPPARSRSSAGPRRRAGTSPPRSPRTTCCSPTSWPRPTTRSTRSTRRCAPPRTSRRCAPALADGTIDIVATDHAPHPHEDKDCEWAAAAFGMLGLETALSVVQETMVDTGLLDWAGVADRMSAAPARIGRVAAPRPPARGGRAGQPRALRPAAYAGWSTPPRWPRCRATRRTPGWSCPAGWSRRSCAAAPPSSTGSSHDGARCSSSRTAGSSAARPTARPARRSARRCSPPG